MNKKIFDCVFSHGDSELIKNRINQNEMFVSHTFIVVKEQNSKEINSHFCDNKNITILIGDKSFDNYKFYSKLLSSKIKEYFQSFEDIIFISEDYEIPFIGLFLEKYYKNFEDTHLHHRVCSIDKSVSQKFLVKGSFVTDFSKITTDKNFLGSNISQKKIIDCFNDKFECGISFVEKNKESYFCNLSEKYIPWELGVKESSKNFLISFDQLDESKLSGYDKIFLIQITDKFPEILYSETDTNVFRFKIFLPDLSAYNDFDFHKNYLKRESLRILNFTSKSDNDIVWIQYENKLESFRIKELKNPS